VTERIQQTEALSQAEADADMRRYLEEELTGQRRQQATLVGRLEDLLLVEPGEDFGSVIMEIGPVPGAMRPPLRRRSLRHVHALCP